MNGLKHLVLRLFFSFCGLYCRFKRVQVGLRCRIGGFPIIMRKRGSQIILGDDVTLHSYHLFNSLVIHRTLLCTDSEDARIEFHEHSGASGAIIICADSVTIGKNTIIGAGTIIDDKKHHSFSKEYGWRKGCSDGSKPIHIGDFCYIGMKCIILKGVTIGDYCVVSAGSVITKNVPTGYLAQGNPAKLYPLPERLRTRPDGSIVPLGENDHKK